MRRRQFVAAASGASVALLAGCSGDGGGGSNDGGGYGGGGSSGGSGTFQLLVSDQPAAIDDFESLDITLSSARVFRANEGDDITSAAVTPDETETETPEPTVDETEAGTADREGFIQLDLDGVTVDLTQVVGDRAVSVLESELEEGRFSGIELRVSSAAGVVEGETVKVNVPSDRLRIVRPFEIAADETLSFVFDINVVQRGPNGYNLLPVIGKSGVVGEDVEVDEVDGDGETTGTETAGATATTDGDSDAGEQATTADR
jgi:hypothetical protein